MKVFRYIRSRRGLGLDICSTEIRLLALQRKKQQICIEKIDAMALPFGAVVEGKIQQAEVVTTHLKMIVQKAEVQHEKVAIALPIQSVISKKITLDENINHINDYFPGISDVLAYDYIKVDKEMLLIATRHDELMRYVSMVESAGLQVSIVDVDLYALARAAHFAISPKVRSYPIFLLELNYLGSQLMLLNQNDILYQQSIHGNWDQVGAQLKTVLKVYFSNEKYLKPKKVYLVGDMLNVTELVEYIHDELFMETEWINLFDAMPNNFLVCCGLALRGVTPC